MAVVGLGSPIWRIAAVTGEEPDDVRAALRALGLLGYDTDDIWTLIGGALNAQLTITELANTLGPKEDPCISTP